MRAHTLTAFIVISCLYLGAANALANGCLAPIRPYAPSTPDALKEYRDILKDEYEAYLRDISRYIKCLDEERGRVFNEARDVANEYDQFLRLTK